MMVKNNYTLYSLTTSDSNIIRYIGITSMSLQKRLYYHLLDSKKSNTHKAKWIKKQLKNGQSIIISPLKSELTKENAIKKEIKLIAQYGDQLTNGTIGGEGVFARTDEIRMKSGIKNKGKKHTKKSRDKMSKSHAGQIPWNKNNNLTQEHKDKISKNSAKIWLGKKLSAEHVANKVEACKKILASKEVKERMSKAHEKTVIQFNKQGNPIQTWESVKKAESTLKIHQISAVCRGERKTAGGFIWRFKLPS